MRPALIAAWLALVGFVWGASPGHFWLDSGELGSAGFELGVTHPPGAAGYVMLLRLATLLPVGPLDFRMTIMSSLCAAATVGLVFHLLARRGAHAWICWGAAAWVAVGWTFSRQARVIEIYAFGALLLMVVLWGFDAAGKSEGRTGRRLVGTFAAVWGVVAFGDLRLALVVPVVLGWWAALRRGRPWARWAPLSVTAALSVVLVIPLASARIPSADWGSPRTVWALFEHLMASSIRSAYSDEMLPSSWELWVVHGQAFVEQLAEDLGPVGPAALVCALLALWLPWRDGRAALRVAAGMTWLCFVEAFYAVGINPMGIDDRQTGVVMGPLAALAVGEALRRALVERARLRWAVVPLVWTILVVPAAWSTARDFSTTRSTMPRAWTRELLLELPPNTLLVMQSDDLAAGVTYAQTVEGSRSDVIAVVAQHLHRKAAGPLASRPNAGRILDAARAGTSETDRIARAVAAHAGPVAFEHAGTSVLLEGPWWSERGPLPLRVIGPDGGPRVAPVDQAHRLVDRWSRRWRSLEDRRRVAVTLSNYARGLVRRASDYDGARGVLEVVLHRVHADDVGTLVALAAILDRVGDHQVAIELSRRALDLDPHRSVALTNLALYLGRDPRTRPEAIQLAERAARLRPWRADVWDRLAGLRAFEGPVSGTDRTRDRADE